LTRLGGCDYFYDRRRLRAPARRVVSIMRGYRAEDSIR
jgi:hypothetical protein